MYDICILPTLLMIIYRYCMFDTFYISMKPWYPCNSLAPADARRLNSLRLSDAYMLQYTNHHWFWQWLVAWMGPSHYLNQCWNIVDWTLRNKLQWNLNQNSHIFIQENAFEKVIWKMAAILSRPLCVKILSSLVQVIVFEIAATSGNELNMMDPSIYSVLSIYRGWLGPRNGTAI